MELKDYLKVIRARKRVILLSIVVVTLVSLVVSIAQPPIYEGRATVLIVESDSGSAVFGSLVPEFSSSPERGLLTQVELMQMRPLAENTIRELGLEESPEDLLARVRVVAEGQTNIVVITATDGEAETAAEIANTLASEYVAWSRDVRRESLREAADEVESRLNDSQAQILELSEKIGDAGMTEELEAELQIATGAYTTLAEKLEQLRIDEQLEGGSGRVVSSATIVLEPVSPRPLRNVALGFAVGLVLGIGLAFLYEYMDDTLNSVEDVERVYGAPVIGTIPDEKAGSDAPRRLTISETPGSQVAEAYRVLRNSLDFINFEQDMKTVMVSSAAPAEGKSTVAANLAQSLAQAGQRVVLVSCDFRRPTTQQFFDVSGMIGLSDVLLGAHSMKAALQRPGDEQLLVMTSGKMPPNPSELLASDKMKELIENLEDWADWVILDTPPLLAVADPASVARWTAGVLIVTKAGSSTRDAGRRAKEMLDKVGARMAGVVVWGIGEGSAREAYGYLVDGYYYAGYYAHPTTARGVGSAGAEVAIPAEPWVPDERPGRKAARFIGRVLAGTLGFLAVVAVAILVAYFMDQYFGWGLMDALYGTLW